MYKTLSLVDQSIKISHDLDAEMNQLEALIQSQKFDEVKGVAKSIIERIKDARSRTHKELYFNHLGELIDALGSRADIQMQIIAQFAVVFEDLDTQFRDYERFERDKLRALINVV